MANAIAVIKRDHRDVKTEYKKFVGARTEAQRATIANRILDSLEAHAFMEESLFYPTVRENGGAKVRELIENSFNEHTEMKLMVTRLREEMGDPAFAMKMDELIGGVLHHVKDEEGKLLPEVRRAVRSDILEELGDRMDELSPSSGKTLPEQLAERARAEAAALTS